MTNGKAFEDIVIDLSAGGSVAGAVIAVLLGGTVSHSRHPGARDDVYHYVSDALGRSIHPPAICTQRKREATNARRKLTGAMFQRLRFSLVLAVSPDSLSRASERMYDNGWVGMKKEEGGRRRKEEGGRRMKNE